MTTYNNLITPPVSLQSIDIEHYYPLIIPDDVVNGFVLRYFTRQSNHFFGDIIEISEHTANNLKSNAMYNVISLEWRITGPLDDVTSMDHIPTIVGVRTANRLTLESIEGIMPGISHRLRNVTQFWKGK